jgi:hypothetical protein
MSIKKEEQLTDHQANWLAETIGATLCGAKVTLEQARQIYIAATEARSHAAEGSGVGANLKAGVSMSAKKSAATKAEKAAKKAAKSQEGVTRHIMKQ